MITSDYMGRDHVNARYESHKTDSDGALSMSYTGANLLSESGVPI